MADELLSPWSFDTNAGEDDEDGEEYISPCGFDEDIVRDENNHAVLQSYDRSVALLQQAQRRLPFLDELHELLIAGLEGKLTGKAKRVYECMRNSEGEWLHVVFENKYPYLLVHHAPTNVLWIPPNTYDCSQLKTPWTRVYNILGLPESGAIGLQLLYEQGTTLLQHIFSRPFKQLPSVFQQNTRIWLPPKGTAWPMARVGFKQYGIVGGPSYVLMASRGVKQE